jgi:hypothetical protein
MYLAWEEKTNLSTMILKRNIVGRHSPRREYKILLNPKQMDTSVQGRFSRLKIMGIGELL